MKAYHPEQNMIIKAQNNALQEKEMDIRSLKAELGQLEMKYKLLEDQGYASNIKNYHELN